MPSTSDQENNSVTNVRPSIARVLRGLSPAHQSILQERYSRVLPTLLHLMSPRDVLERNRAWPGVSPVGKTATRLLQYNRMRATRMAVHDYAALNNEDADELWTLIRAYCRYGPIGLIEALPAEAPPLLPSAINDIITFHRLAKHPRSNGGMYIRELATEYARDLGLPDPVAFAVRHAWANDQPRARWFVSDSTQTQHLTRSRRRLNIDKGFPHREWRVCIAPSGIQCLRSERHQIRIQPWVVALVDTYTDECMGFRLCAHAPTLSDVLRTLRWSIWHYGAPRWISRGCPDHLVIPSALLTRFHDDPETAPSINPVALRYLHTRVVTTQEQDTELPSIVAESARQVPLGNFTLYDVQSMLIDYISDSWRDRSFGPLAPEALTEAGVSLPWHDSIAASRLLTSLGCHQVSDGLIHPSGIPYDVALPDGTVVDVRYDPDDANCVWTLTDTVRFAIATAARFEHSIPWCDLFAHPD